MLVSVIQDDDLADEGVTTEGMLLFFFSQYNFVVDFPLKFQDKCSK